MDDIQKKIEELEDEQCAELLVKQVEERVTYQCLHILDHCNTLEEAKKKIEALLNPHPLRTLTPAESAFSLLFKLCLIYGII